VGLRRWTAACLVLGVGLLLGRLPARGAEPEPRRLGFVDLHADLPYQHIYKQRPFERGSGQYLASELARAGVVGVVLPLFVPHGVAPAGPTLDHLEDSYRRVFDALTRTPPFALPSCRAPDGAVRTWLAFEGAAPLADRPEDLVGWVARGLRSVGLVHTRHNALAGSSGEPGSRERGLSARGAALVREAHALGVAVDVSHASRRTVDDVIALARADGMPVIATHTNALALADHPRNLDDAALAAIASTGGVVGVNFHAPFLARNRDAALADVVRHVRHLVSVMGVEHVAFGSDFEGGISPPPELRDVRELPRLARALEASGMTRADVARVFGGNALRVLCRGEAPSVAK
jgi:membrane dipeptidase